MKILPDTWVIQLTRDDVKNIQKDLENLMIEHNKNHKTKFWHGVNEKYPTLMNFHRALPFLETFEDDAS